MKKKLGDCTINELIKFCKKYNRCQDKDHKFCPLCQAGCEDYNICAVMLSDVLQVDCISQTDIELDIEE